MKNKSKPVKKKVVKKENNVPAMVAKFAPTEGFRVTKETDIIKNNLIVRYDVKGDSVLLNEIYNGIYNDIADNERVIFDVITISNKSGESSGFIIIKDIFRYGNVPGGFDDMIQQFPLFTMDIVMDNHLQIEMNFFNTALNENDACIIEIIEEYLQNISKNQAKIINDNEALRNKLINTPFEI